MTGEPIAWARRWHVDGIKPVKERNENGRMAWPIKFKYLPVTQTRCFSDDVPLFAAIAAQADEPVLSMSMFASKEDYEVALAAQPARCKMTNEELKEGLLNPSKEFWRGIIFCERFHGITEQRGTS